MNIKRIERLRRLILAQPHARADDHHGFNMREYRHACGTPSCIAGYAAHMAMEDKKYKPKAMEGQGNVPVSVAAARYLGIPMYKVGNPLFMPLGVPSYDDITPAQAAETLTRLMDTGKVDWSHVPGYAGGNP